MIPFKKINLGKAYKEIKPLFKSGAIGLGNVVFEFEKQLARFVGSKYVVTLDSCTSALFFSLKFEKNQGLKEVSIPSMTVPLVANACVEAGLKIRFNDHTDWVGSAYDIIGSNMVDSAHQLDRAQLPLYDTMTDAQVNKVIKVVKKYGNLQNLRSS